MSAFIERSYYCIRFFINALIYSSIKDCYDKSACFYDRLFGRNQSQYSKEMVNFLTANCTDRFNHALDLGCGTGILTRNITSIADCVIGIDLAVEMITQARCNAKSSNRPIYHTGDILNLPFKDRCFDLITCLGVITHILPSEFSRFIMEINRVSSSDAMIIIGLPPLPWRMFYQKKCTFILSPLDRPLISLYNRLQVFLNLKERRGVYSPEFFKREFAKCGYLAASHRIGNLAVVAAMPTHSKKQTKR